MSFQPDRDVSQDEIDERVAELIADHDVVLFMKGSELRPRCGFSRRALALVDAHCDEYVAVDVLDALEQYRTALKEYSDWETIPQAYVDGEFVGDSDVLAALDERGELAATLAAE